MFKLFTKENSHTHVVLIFDIGSGSIGGALASVSPEGTTIHYSIRRELPPTRRNNSEEFLSSLKYSVSLVAECLHKDGLKELKKLNIPTTKISKSYCILSSLWYVSELRDLKVRREKPFVVTISHIEGLIERQSSYVKSSQLLTYAEESTDELVKLDHKIIDVRINGYATSAPYGKSANELEASVYLSLTPKIVPTTIDRAISKFFHPEEMHFHSVGLTTFTVLRDLFSTTDDYMFLDISGELTDVFVIKNGALKEAASFPIGSETIVRSLSKKLRTSYESALSKASLALSEKSDESHSSKTIKSLAEAQKKWSESFKQVAENFTHTSFLPKNIFFISDPSTTQIFKYFIEDIEIEYNRRCRDVCQITLVESPFFKDYIKGKNNDSFLSLHALFTQKSIEK
jgi:hypothetical protein